jgi:hypothetical protein
MDKKYKLLYCQNDFPVFQNRIYKIEKEAVNCQKGSVRLVYSPEDAMNVLPEGSTIIVMNPNYMKEIKDITKNRYVCISVDCKEF